MKTHFKILLSLTLLLLLCSSCCKTDDEGLVIPDPVLGCLDINALNYNSLADTEDGSCRYSVATFYAKFNFFQGIPIVNIDVTINGEFIGSISDGFIWPNGPGNCSSQGTVPYQFLDSTPVDWNATLFLANGQSFSTGGIRTPSSSIECIKINVTI